MVCTIKQVCFKVCAGEAGNYARFQSSTQTFFNTGNIFFGNVTADNGVFKFKAVVTFNRFKLDFNLSKLTGATRLFLVRIFNITRFGNGFAVSNLRFADIGVNFEFSLQTVDDNFQVQFAHTFNNGLA